MLPGDSAGQAVQQAFLGRWFCIGRLKANKFLLQSRPGTTRQQQNRGGGQQRARSTGGGALDD